MVLELSLKNNRFIIGTMVIFDGIFEVNWVTLENRYNSKNKFYSHQVLMENN